MHIGIDAREIQKGVYTGLGRYLANFIDEFIKSQSFDNITLFSEQPISSYHDRRVSNIIIPPTLTFFWDQILLPQAIQRQHIDVFFSPYYKIPLLARCKIISSILDLMYLVFPPYKNKLNWFSKFYYKFICRIFMLRANRVLTCSEYSKTDIHRLYKVSPEKISIIPLSLSPIYHPEDDLNKFIETCLKFNAREGYVLYIGNFKPHKNVSTLIRAFAQIHPEYPELKLVLVGPKTHQFEMLEKLTLQLHIDENVIFPGTIFENEQPHLVYAAAEMLIFPSQYEGFGLPLIEAMACQTPIIAANCTSIPEIVQKAGLLVDPENCTDYASAMKQILQNQKVKKDLILKGSERVKQYNSTVLFKQMYQIFQKLYETK